MMGHVYVTSLPVVCISFLELFTILSMTINWRVAALVICSVQKDLFPSNRVYFLMINLLRAGYQKSSHLGLIVVSFAAISMCFNMAFAQAPVATVDITSPTEGKPYGGAPIGKLNMYLQGDRIKFVANMNISPEINKVFEGWLVDAGNKASGYMLSLGKFNKTQVLDFDQSMVNPYTYLEFQVTQEPSQDLDPKAAKATGGVLLAAPFGQ